MTGADRVSVTPQGQPLTEYGVGSTYSSSDLIGADAAIEWTGTTGKVTGEIKQISDWTEFDPTDNTGHFFPFVLDEQYNGEEITVTGSKTAKARSRYWVVKVDTAKTFTVSKGAETLFVLDFNSANYK